MFLQELSTEETQPKIKLPQKKKYSKTVKPEKINKKLNEISDLTILQLRHENEKNLVDSMKLLVFKI